MLIAWLGPKRNQFWCGILLPLLFLTLPAHAAVKERALEAEANVMVELTFRATRGYSNPFNQITLDVVFTDPKGREFRVPAFWAGTNSWKARYSSPVVGIHRFRSESSEPQDKGLHHVSGKVRIKPYNGQNLLYAHGPVHVGANKRFLEYADGTPFFWLGDTWWMGLCHRLHFPEEFKELAADRKQKGFNVIQIVAGLYPDMFPFDPRGANEAGYPWQTNYSSIRPEYFDAADRRLMYLVEQGFTPCIVGAWGYFLPWMGVDKAKQHWRYLIARYGALPVVWCAAGEANLPWYLAKGFPYDDRKQVKDWTEVMRFMRATDPFHRPITVHPTGIGRLSARAVTEDLSLLDIDMLQTPHGQRDAVPVTVRTVRESYTDMPVMPVINGEAAYEMLGDNLPTEWTRRMFWVCLMNGAAGHTYGANGIWQVNRKGQPHGPSPHHKPGVGYGKIPWDEAMNLPGSRQVGLGKKLLEEFPWHRFQPHPEWAAFEQKPGLSLESSQWLWFPEGNPAQDAPAEKRFFRKTFILPEGKAIRSAHLRISVDDRFSARLNGAFLGASNPGAEPWKNGKQFNDIASHLVAGSNVLAIVGENMPAGGPNPAGLICCLEVRFTDGEPMKIISDNTWRSSRSGTQGWDKAGFDETAWEQAMIVGKYGDGPWGTLAPLENNEVFGPQSAGLPELVRIIYVPESEPVVVKSLGRNNAYSAVCFDPVTGSKTALGAVKADKQGSWTCPVPESGPGGHLHDWVLILESEKKR